MRGRNASRNPIATAESEPQTLPNKAFTVEEANATVHLLENVFERLACCGGGILLLFSLVLICCNLAKTALRLPRPVRPGGRQSRPLAELAPVSGDGGALLVVAVLWLAWLGPGLLLNSGQPTASPYDGSVCLHPPCS